MDLKTKMVISRMEKMTPFASKRSIMTLLKATCGNAFDQMDNDSKKMIERMAKATEQAYWLGISDGKAGKPLDVDERLDMEMKTGSELSKTVCDFMLKAYTGGYELGKIERITFGKEVNA